MDAVRSAVAHLRDVPRQGLQAAGQVRKELVARWSIGAHIPPPGGRSVRDTDLIRPPAEPSVGNAPGPAVEPRAPEVAPLRPPSGSYVLHPHPRPGGQMKRIDAVKKGHGWAGESGGRTVPNTESRTRAETVRKVAAAAETRRPSDQVSTKPGDSKVRFVTRSRARRRTASAWTSILRSPVPAPIRLAPTTARAVPAGGGAIPIHS